MAISKKIAMHILRYSIIILLILFEFPDLMAQEQDYLQYQYQIIQAEKLIAEESFNEAFMIFENTINDYDFVFLRDYKVATQLAVVVGNDAKAIEYLKLAIQGGWPKIKIRKNKLLRPLLDSISKAEYEILKGEQYLKIDNSLRQEVHEMYKMDQKMALKALLKIGQKAKIKYTENKFAPHSIQQLNKLRQILHTQGYPGEKLIGNDYWASTILSHHNSISADFNERDTLYNNLKPELLNAIKSGEMSPFEYALIDNWKIASQSNHSISSYGYLGPDLNEERLANANKLRHQIGLRSIETRNALVDIQEKTGMDFYLPGNPWQEGKITINDQ